MAAFRHQSQSVAKKRQWLQPVFGGKGLTTGGPCGRGGRSHTLRAPLPAGGVGRPVRVRPPGPGEQDTIMTEDPAWPRRPVTLDVDADDLDPLLSKEWLVGNRVGAYASSSPLG